MENKIVKKVVIIGAGLGGLLAGIRLKENGINDFLIIDRNSKRD